MLRNKRFDKLVARGEIGELRRILLASDEASACRAASALGKVGGKHAEQALLDAVADRRDRVRDEAVRALVECDEHRDAEPILSALGKTRASLTAGDVLDLGLWRLKSLDLVDILIDGLSDEDGRVRRLSAAALGELKDSRATEPLADALDAPDRRLRTVAGETLARMGDRRGIEVLISALDDPHWIVRRMAKRRLLEAGNQAREQLLEAQQHASSRRVRRAAGGILRRLGRS